MGTICRGPAWVDHSQGGLVYALGHLAPAFVEFHIPAVPVKGRKPGRAEIRTRLYFSYSHHCFTRATEAADGDDELYTCSARGETRTFCTDRWEESKALPTIMAGMRNCYFTRHHNYFVWRDPQKPELGEYFVYFRVALNPGKQFVDVFIESAYPRQDGDRVRRGASKVGFNVLVVNALRGVATHAPPP